MYVNIPVKLRRQRAYGVYALSCIMTHYILYAIKPYLCKWWQFIDNQCGVYPF